MWLSMTDKHGFMLIDFDVGPVLAKMCCGADLNPFGDFPVYALRIIVRNSE